MPPPTLPQPLHSILLVIKTRSGPRLVLHYPPSPDAQARASPIRSPYSEDDLYDGVDYLAQEQEGEEVGYGYQAGLSGAGDPTTTTTPSPPSTPTSTPHRNDEYDSGLEFGSASADSMARLLAPSSRGWDGRRFELGLEERTYLARPMFERVEGGWRRKGKRQDKGEGGRDERDERGSGTRNLEEKRKMRAEEKAQTGTARDENVGPEVDAEILEEGSDTDKEEEEHTEAAKGSMNWIGSWDAAMSTQSKGTPTQGRQSEDENNSDDDDEIIYPALTTSTSSIRIPERPKPNSDSHPQGEGSFIPASFATTGTDSSLRSQNSSVEARMPQTLSMFSLVFVLEPTADADVEERVDEIYGNVVKKLTKALKWTQKRHGWLWSQCRTVMGVREKGKERGVSYKSLWPSIAAKSSLARALASTYDHIKLGEIAHVTLGPSKSPLRLSLQIPWTITTDSAPTPMHPQTPGLFTTTYNPYTADDLPPHETSITLSPHTAILLLTPVPQLLHDLSTTTPSSSSSNLLHHYIKHTTPTKTLLQQTRTTNFPLHTLRTLSTHLIHHRHAIPIPPLHPNHTYALNPNADFSRFEAASEAYARQFPLLPSLRDMLVKLSGHLNVNPDSGRTVGPLPYGRFIPSSDHERVYMEVLEWLMRGPWLVHLQTFAWVRVGAAVKAAVAREVRWEERVGAESLEGEEMGLEGAGVVVSDDEGAPSQGGVSRRKRSSGGSAAVPAQSPRLRALLGPPKAGSEAGSSSSARTTVRISNGLRGAGQASKRRGSGSRSIAAKRMSDESSASRSQVLEKSQVLSEEAGEEEEEEEIREEDFKPSLVLSPHRADAIESRWLRYIGETLPTEELKVRWPKLVRYFDGKHALEEIALREGLKRKVVNPLLQRLMAEKDGDGVLRVVRHW